MSAKKLRLTAAPLVPVFTRTNVVVQPFPDAMWAMEPALTPVPVKTGIVVSALAAVKRMPKRLIRPPAGVSNSAVPRIFAVAGNWLAITNEVCALPARETVPVPI